MARHVLLLFLCAALSCCIDAKNLFESFKERRAVAEEALKNNIKSVDAFVRKRRSADELADSSEEAAEFVSFLVNLGWEQNKLGLLSGFIEDVSDHETNITIIGWQHVLESDHGDVKQVNAIELVLVPKEKSPDDVTNEGSNEELFDVDTYERIIPHDDVNELKETFEPLAKLGIPASATFEQFDDDGEREALFFMDLNTLFISAENFTIFNLTSVEPLEHVDEVIKKIRESDSEPDNLAVFKYDVDGKFIKEKSTISPLLWGNVIDHYEATDEILLKSPQIVAEAQAEGPRDAIPELLVKKFTKHWPKYEWRVVVDPVNFYVTRDLAVEVSWDNVDFYEDSYVSYLLNGIKKE